MDQVSRPVLIALGAVLLLAAVWLVALRPKPAVSVSDTPLAPTTAIPKAKAAAAASDATNAKVQAATGGTSAPAATPAAPAQTAAPAQPATPAAPAKPFKAGTRLDRPIVREMRAGKVVVMLFWNAKAADDIASRGALRAVPRHGGKVAVHVVPISDVGRYPTITQGVTIGQSPTTLVIGRHRKTRVITGLTEPRELQQAVGDALAGR